MYSTIYSYQILKKIEISPHICIKYSSMKLHENPSNGNRVVPRGQTNGRTDKTKLLVAFRNFANAPKKNTNVVEGTVARVPSVEDAHSKFARVQNCCGRGKWHTALTLQITPLPSLPSSTQTYLL